MTIERSRIWMLTGGAAFVLSMGSRLRPLAAAAPLPDITVHKDPT